MHERTLRYDQMRVAWAAPKRRAPAFYGFNCFFVKPIYASMWEQDWLQLKEYLFWLVHTVEENLLYMHAARKKVTQ